MDFKRLLEPTIKDFIRQNENADIPALALKKPPGPDWPYPLIIDQIKARQKAKIKMPLWLTHHEDLLLPPSDILEQASSAATAHYKARLVQGERFLDLTGGAGMDGAAFAQYFSSGICIDQNQDAASLLAHNMPKLTDKPIDIYTARAEDFIAETPAIDFIYIDPQRRDDRRKGFFRLKDCAPDVLALLPEIKKKTDKLMIKTSPMLDISQTLKDLPHVSAVHIVEWRGDCKEVLYILDFNTALAPQDIPHICVTLDDDGSVLKDFTFTRAEEEKDAPLAQPQIFLYEPGPAFQKAGGFNALANTFQLNKLHKHTHLYTSETLCSNFPGRIFEIQALLPVNRKALGFEKANLTIRNFPSDVATLRKKLKLKEGGADYLFACTLSDEQKSLIHCKKSA